ncbi:MAG TPA: vanadium-dependent haloperoxidase [Thermoanaerobaculia bacterium]|nr:vanadium-dependent haloperoxidase [Thermoanaerobaculia bacterium]
MKKTLRRLALLAASSALALPAAAPAGVVLDWNEIALAQVAAAGQHPTEASRTMAMVHGAIFDAVDAVERRYAPYAFDGTAPEGASAEAAAVAAARAVLTGLFPERRPEIEDAAAGALGRIAAGAGRAPGVALGEAVGARYLALRADDGCGAPERYRPRTTPGVYVPTTVPVASEWGRVRPWLLEDGAALRPAAPLDLAGEQWARDYAEIRSVGGRESTQRSAEQTDVARFWTITGPATWNPVIRSLVSSRPGSLVDDARLFALANLAAADALIAVFDAKYAYGFWRPITAIRDGDLDGNDATEPVAGWSPLVETPMHPEYPCAHCITSAAVGAVLESEFGTGEVPPVVMTSPGAPGVVRRWTRVGDYVAEVSAARIWGGIHYRFSTEVGAAMGRTIGALAVTQLMRPVDEAAAEASSPPEALRLADTARP